MNQLTENHEQNFSLPQEIVPEPTPQVSMQEISAQTNDQKKRTWKYKLILLILAVFTGLIGLIVFLFFPRNTVLAQAQELFMLYFQVDHVRTDSAKIFAGLLESQRSPERIGDETQEIGEKLPLEDKNKLVSQLSVNRREVLDVVEIIEAESFTLQEIITNHLLIKNFYNRLFKFEESIISQLERVSSDEEFIVLVNEIF